MENLNNDKSISKEKNKLQYWQEKFQKAKNAYDSEIKEITDNESAYEGTRDLMNINTDKVADKQGKIIRKVCFELIESQVDSNIPLPKVVSRKANKEDLAQKIEDVIKSEIDRLDTEEFNDTQERITPIAGGAVFYLEWDNSIKTSSSVGDITLQVLDSKQVIPQDGVYDLEEMDYVFLLFEQSKQKIKQKYGVDVQDEDGNESDKEENNDEVRTHVFALYRNDNGGIGLYSWVGDTEVQDYDNYFERKQEVCSKCGAIRRNNVEKCTDCNSKDFKLVKREKEIIKIPRMVTETVIDPTTGLPTTIQTEKFIDIEVPYYELNQFPLIVRKNVSKINKFLGSSDVSYIKDLQNEIAIYNVKIKEKTLKGGSVVVKPKGVDFKTTDEELKILEIDNVQDLAKIKVFNLQADSSQDVAMQENEYQYSRQTIGITDSFQGRQDPTATSGKAKEFAAAQTAGRLNSKRTMKDFAFSKLYQLMFKFLLAFADEPRTYITQTEDGDDIYKTFSRYDFLEQDSTGNYYYNDEFIFSTDVSATLSQNRESMWQETRLNFTSGAYGPTNDISTLIMFWTIMDKLHYPGAKMALKQLTNRQEEINTQQQLMAQLPSIGGDLNDKINNV